jgi:hypothetical protein
MALERAMRALACWYEPRALLGSFERLKLRQLGAAAPALEYLSHVLPRSVFRPLSKIFEEERPDAGAPAATDPGELAKWIRAAWQSGDAWLKACAVRASWYVPELTADTFALESDESAVVRAEVEARFQGKEQAQLPALAARTASC